MVGGMRGQVNESRGRKPLPSVDLTARSYDTPRGKRFHGSIQLEHKDDLKACVEGSPDHGDTLAMTFAVKVAAKQRPKYGSNLIYGYPGQRSQSRMQ
jgi:hypothetical protein